MVSLRRTLLALALGSAMISRAAAAQHGSASLIHTVSVTVPPRVRVQIGTFAPSAASTVKVGVNASTQTLSLSVRATESWVLAIGSNASTLDGNSPMRWSLDSSSGYSTLTSTHANVASGAVSADPATATVFFRNSAVTAAPVVLTLSAP